MGQSGKTTVIPDYFPSFQVPGYEMEMESFRKLFFQQYETAGPAVPLWDEWLPMSTLWPAISEGHKHGNMVKAWARALSTRFMNAEGYVVTEQHDTSKHLLYCPFLYMKI